jgi:hypothetical protein
MALASESPAICTPLHSIRQCGRQKPIGSGLTGKVSTQDKLAKLKQSACHAAAAVRCLFLHDAGQRWSSLLRSSFPRKREPSALLFNRLKALDPRLREDDSSGSTDASGRNPAP